MNAMNVQKTAAGTLWMKEDGFQ